MAAEHADDDSAGVIIRDRPEADPARADIESVREMLQVLVNLRMDQGRAHRAAVAIIGTEVELASAAETVLLSLHAALDRVDEARIASARDQGWLTADEARFALKEKRQRELAKLRRASGRDARSREAE